MFQWRRYFFFLILSFGFNSYVLAETGFHFQRIAPIEDLFLADVNNEARLIIQRINQSLTIPDEVVFLFGAEDGPLYDPALKQVWMPDEFTLEVRERFLQANYVEDEQALFDVTVDVVEHTLYHELSHALIDVLQIPVTGREEDSADNLATLLVILTNQEGGEVALSAADLFDLEGHDIEELTDEDYWGEHSLDYQRFYNTVCHIYGSEPGHYRYLIEELDIADERAELCIEDYAKMRASWKQLLLPYLKDKTLLN